MSRKTSLVFFFLIFFFTGMCSVLATMIGSSVPYDDRIVIFKPGGKASFDFTVGQGVAIAASIRPEKQLEPYVKLIDPKPNGGDRTVTVQIEFGDYLPPGEYQIGVNAKETSVPGGVGAVTEVGTAIRVRSLATDKVISCSADVKDVNEGENATLIAFLTSWTYQSIESVYADFDVFDSTGNKTGTYRTNQLSLKSAERGSLSGIMETQGIKPGWFRAIATVYYDGKSIQCGNEFRIGTLAVDIVSYTKELKAGSLNKFEMKIHSNWNDILKEVYGTVELTGRQEKTPTIEVPRMGDGILTAYLDTHEVPIGDQPIKMKIFYNNQNSEREGTVKIMPVEEKVVEKPKETGSRNYIYVALIILVMVNLFFLLWKRQKKNPPVTNTA